MPDNEPDVIEGEAKEMPEETALTVQPPAPDGGSLSRITAEALEVALVEEQKKRELIEKYIKNNMVQGVDYDTIPGCGKKPTLLKPGAERVCALLHLQPKFYADTESYQMMPKKLQDSGIFCYRCDLVHTATGEVVGEGRGVGELGDKKRDANSTIKIAQKRAQVDAVLRVAALSDRFTQDIEEMSQTAPAAAQNTDAALPKKSAPRQSSGKGGAPGDKDKWKQEPCDARVEATAQKVFDENGIDMISVVKQEFGVDSIRELTKGDVYHKLMAPLKSGGWAEYAIAGPAADEEIDLDNDPFAGQERDLSDK